MLALGATQSEHVATGIYHAIPLAYRERLDKIFPFTPTDPITQDLALSYSGGQSARAIQPKPWELLESLEPSATMSESRLPPQDPVRNTASLSLVLFNARRTRDAVPCTSQAHPDHPRSPSAEALIRGERIVIGDRDRFDSERSYAEGLAGEPIYARDFRRALVTSIRDRSNDSISDSDDDGISGTPNGGPLTPGDWFPGVRIPTPGPASPAIIQQQPLLLGSSASAKAPVALKSGTKRKGSAAAAEQARGAVIVIDDDDDDDVPVRVKPRPRSKVSGKTAPPLKSTGKKKTG